MQPIRFAFAAIALTLATTAVAVPTASTYSFSTPTANSHTPVNTSAGWNATSGTNWGNSMTFTSTGIAIPVTVTAWASTGGVGGFNGTIQSAALTRYGTDELAITSRSSVTTGGTSTGTSGAATSAGATTNAAMNAELLNWVPNSAANSNQHAVDNAGGYESLMFSFTSAVTLKDVSIGFPGTGSAVDSDATVLVYTGSGDPTASLSTRTYAQLLQNGWQLAGNLLDIASPTNNGKEALPISSSGLSSKYWMVGAYMAVGGNSAANLNDGRDYVKVSGLTAVRAVPEPDSLALLGIASITLLARRRGARRS